MQHCRGQACQRKTDCCSLRQLLPNQGLTKNSALAMLLVTVCRRILPARKIDPSELTNIPASWNQDQLRLRLCIEAILSGEPGVDSPADARNIMEICVEYALRLLIKAHRLVLCIKCGRHFRKAFAEDSLPPVRIFADTRLLLLFGSLKRRGVCMQSSHALPAG